MHIALHIASDHPSFAGHFPGFPVLPGAVLLDETLRAIESARGIDLSAWQISSAKFLDGVRPGDNLVLEHDAPGAGLICFAIHAGNRKVVSGTLSAASQDC
jgi:3-hydroxyacyl-[acyl-carrier-protein] dehydratase